MKEKRKKEFFFLCGQVQGVVREKRHDPGKMSHRPPIRCL
jgi:hypothetical protein